MPPYLSLSFHLLGKAHSAEDKAVREQENGNDLLQPIT